MVKETYSVTLDKELVLRAKKISKRYGSKLSPILNNLLEDWCDDEEKANEMEEQE